MAAMPSARADAGLRRCAACPRISIVPPSGWCAPVMTLISVDLPAPFSPSNACTSPARSENDTPLSARTAPNDFVTQLSCRRGVSISYRTLFDHCYYGLTVPDNSIVADTGWDH